MNFSKLKNRPFMLVNFIHQPAPGERTSQKNWGEIGKWQTKESIFFVDRINNKHLTDYAIIIDLLHAVVVKSCITDVSKGEIYAHYVNKYKANVMQAVNVWRKKRGNELNNLVNVEQSAARAMKSVVVDADHNLQLQSAVAVDGDDAETDIDTNTSTLTDENIDQN
jgi:hypothetical protein